MPLWLVVERDGSIQLDVVNVIIVEWDRVAQINIVLFHHHAKFKNHQGTRSIEELLSTVLGGGFGTCFNN